MVLWWLHHLVKIIVPAVASIQPYRSYIISGGMFFTLAGNDWEKLSCVYTMQVGSCESTRWDVCTDISCQSRHVNAAARVKKNVESSTGWTLKQVATSMKCLWAPLHERSHSSQLASCTRGFSVSNKQMSKEAAWLWSPAKGRFYVWRKVWNDKEKWKVGKGRLTRIENLVWLISPSKQCGKTKTKLSVFLNKMDHKLSDYESLNEVMLMKRC
jgi:hypothetical protein